MKRKLSKLSSSRFAENRGQRSAMVSARGTPIPQRFSHNNVREVERIKRSAVYYYTLGQDSPPSATTKRSISRVPGRLFLSKLFLDRAKRRVGATCPSIEARAGCYRVGHWPEVTRGVSRVPPFLGRNAANCKNIGDVLIAS